MSKIVDKITLLIDTINIDTTFWSWCGTFLEALLSSLWIGFNKQTFSGLVLFVALFTTACERAKFANPTALASGEESSSEGNSNDSPFVENITLNIKEDVATASTFIGYDDPEEHLYYYTKTDPAGTVSNILGAAFTFTPAANAWGTDSFTYVANDYKGESNTATVTINITRLADDALTGADWPLTTAGNYAIAAGASHNNAGGYVELDQYDQTDDANGASGFGNGSGSGAAWSTSEITLTATTNTYIHDSGFPQYSSLYAYYQFEGSAADYSDTQGNNSGTAHGSSTTTTPTDNFKVGSRALDMNDGAFDFINLSHDATIEAQATSLSVFMWVRRATSGSYDWLLDKRDADVDGWFIALNRVAEGNGIRCGNDAVILSGTTAITDTNWHHIGCVWDRTANFMYMYLDGHLEDSVAIADLAGTTTAPRIGSTFAGTEPVDGQIDDLAIWSTALTAAEIHELYNRQVATYAGIFTSRIMDSAGDNTSQWTNIAWSSTLPYFKPIPDVESNELTSVYSGLSNDTLLSNLVLLAHLDETSENGATNVTDFEDDSSDGNHGTATGIPNASYGRYGKLGVGAYFDGTDDYIDFTDIATPGTNGATVSLWFYVNDSTTRVLYNQSDDANNGAVRIFGQDIEVRGNSGGTWRALTKNNAVSIMQWHHLIVLYTAGGAVEAYLDGVQQVPTTPVTDATFDFDGVSFRLGYGPSSDDFAGMIDELAVWGRTLSGAEAQTIYRRVGNRVRIQVMSCNDAACSGETWGGKSSSSGTFGGSESYTEAYAAPTVNTAASVSLSQGVDVATNQYFRYRILLETDSTSFLPDVTSVVVSPDRYNDSDPTVYNLTGSEYMELSTFTADLDASCNDGTAGAYRFQLASCSDATCSGGFTWYYWDGAAWSTTTTVGNSNTWGDISTNISSFDTAMGVTNPNTAYIFWRAYLVTGTVQAGNTSCQLTRVQITGGT